MNTYLPKTPQSFKFCKQDETNWSTHYIHSKPNNNKKALIVQVFLKLLTLEDTVTKMHKRSSFWKPFGSRRGEWMIEWNELLTWAKNWLFYRKNFVIVLILKTFLHAPNRLNKTEQRKLIAKNMKINNKSKKNLNNLIIRVLCRRGYQ